MPKSEGLYVNCDSQGEIRAACSFGFTSDNKYILISGIGVSINDHGKGLGTKILATVIRDVRRVQPSKPIVALVHEQNLPAQALFARAGFKVLSKGERKDHDLWVLG